MTNNLETFPQHAAESKPSITELVQQGQNAEHSMVLVRQHYPDAALAEVLAVIESKMLEAEHHFETVQRLVGLADEAGVGDDVSLVDGLRSLADQGDAQAVDFLAQLTSPKMTLFVEDMEAAVALDPYWYTNDDGSWSVKDGATYKTPEELVAAYRRSSPVEAAE